MKNPNRPLVTVACVFAASIGTALGAPIEGPTVYFYTAGTNSKAGSAKPGTWGNGTCSVSKDVQYDGGDALKVVTRNFNEGMRLDVTPALDLGSYRANGFVRLRMRFSAPPAPPQTQPAGGQGDPGGLAPGMGGNPGFGGPAGAPPAIGMPFPGVARTRTSRLVSPRLGPAFPQFGQLPAMPRPGEGGAFGGFPAAPAEGEAPTGEPPPHAKFLVTLQLDKGVLSSFIDLDKQRPPPDDDGWRMYILALNQMRGTPGAAGSLRRVLVTSDQEYTWYLSQAALANELGAMSVSIRRPGDPPDTQTAEITVRPGALSLVADIEAGAADPAVEWNFDADNSGAAPQVAPKTPPRRTTPAVTVGGGMPGAMGAAPDVERPAVVAGPRVDARGLSATFEYPNEEQNYRVQVTVRDRSGKKTPAHASLLVKVRG